MDNGNEKKKVDKGFNYKLLTSSSPHIFSKRKTPFIMYDVIIALIPLIVWAVWMNGFYSLLVIGLSVVTAVFTEAITQKAFGRKITIRDGSAVITGILLAFNVPPSAPWWMIMIGSAFAIVIVKQFFGGLGYNFLNPALGARAFMMASWPRLMTSGFAPIRGYIAGVDGVTSATPLNIFHLSLKNPSMITEVQKLTSWDAIWNMFTGNIGGVIGETSALLILVGAIYLLLRKVIDLRIPLSYILTVLVLNVIIFFFSPFKGKVDLLNFSLFQLFSGGLMLGAFFMATDYATSPITPKGKIIFGIGCGILTVIIRWFGGYPEGVSYSILLMNVATPLIEKFTIPKKFGEVKR